MSIEDIEAKPHCVIWIALDHRGRILKSSERFATREEAMKAFNETDKRFSMPLSATLKQLKFGSYKERWLKMKYKHFGRRDVVYNNAPIEITHGRTMTVIRRKISEKAKNNS